MKVLTWCLVTTALVASAPLARAQADDNEPKGRYIMKDEVAPSGSHLRRRSVYTDLPPGKRYAELSDEEKALVRDIYENMPPDDEPPYPINGTESILKAIMKGQQTYLANGELVLYVDVDPKGKARSVSVLKSPDPLMTKYAAAVLMQERYKPGICKGSPCAMQYPFRIKLYTYL